MSGRHRRPRDPRALPALAAAAVAVVTVTAATAVGTLGAPTELEPAEATAAAAPPVPPSAPTTAAVAAVTPRAAARTVARATPRAQARGSSTRPSSTRPTTPRATTRPSTTRAAAPASSSAPTTVRAAARGCARAGYGGVRPHVAAAADHLTGRYPGITSVIGRASRSGASDHPAGLALDLMVGRATGDQLAAYVLAHRAQLGVTYVIWRQRINHGSGWRPMEDRGGITANHYDHVHVSFSASAGSGLPC